MKATAPSSDKVQREPAPGFGPSITFLVRLLRFAILSLIAVVLIFYVLLLGLGSIPFFQRHFVYAHKLHTAYFTDIANPELWGFAKNQVRPFVHRPKPGDSIFAWHIIPNNQYVDAHAETWSETGDLDTHAQSKAFGALITNPESKLVLYFHGNAGHVAQNLRPSFYRMAAGIPDCHVVAIDYRGFGWSKMEGSPSEASLIEDGVEMVRWATEHIPPSRIALVGHSLGTGVAGGVAAHYAQHDVEFAGIVLVSGFSHLTPMLAEYRIGGHIPVFGPLRFSPRMMSWFNKFIVDEWNTKARIHDTVKATQERARLAIVHGASDRDIPSSESQKLFDAAVGALGDATSEEDIEFADASFVHQRTRGDVNIRFEAVPHAGHNDIIGLPSTVMAIDRCFRK